MSEIELSEDQAKVVEAVESGQSILCTGQAGVGKSVIMDRLDMDRVATTGVAALNVGGTTLHRYMGLGYQPESAQKVFNNIFGCPGVYPALRSLERLAIDEAGMCGGNTFQLVNELLQLVKDNEEPFGGVQLALFGDFLQLPPINEPFAFETQVWKDMGIQVHHLTKSWRQADQEFVDVLGLIREARVDHPSWEKVTEFLRCRYRPEIPEERTPIILHAKNVDVDAENAAKLEKLPGDTQTYHAHDIGKDSAIAALNKGCRIPQQLDLKIGARVMLLANLAVEAGLANGSLGTVVDLAPAKITVDFDSAGVQEITRVKFEQIVHKKVVATRKQFPLRLAYSITVHKCVAPETLVMVGGMLQKIEGIGQQGVIRTIDGDKYYTNKVTNFSQRCLKITTSKGYTITVSEDHHMFVGEGREKVAARDLKKGALLRLVVGDAEFRVPQKIALPADLEIDPRATRFRVPKCLDEDFAEFLGLLVADGTVFPRGFRLVKRHADVVERFSELARKIFGVAPKKCKVLGTGGVEVCSAHLASWLRQIGGVRPNRKDIPSEVLAAHSGIQKSFLKGLFEDGSCTRQGYVELSNKHKDLLSKVQVMLLAQGVISTLAEYSGTPRLSISGASARRFRKQIGFVSRAKNEKPIAPAKHESDIIPSTLLDPVDTIESVVSPTMCVEVPETGSFVQNGFDGGNSQGLTFDSMIVYLPGPGEFCPPALSYVALSRCRTRDGLYLMKCSKSSFKASPKALEFYRGIGR